jgi:hypothetical protein
MLKTIIMATPLAVVATLSSAMSRVATFFRAFNYASVPVTASDNFNRANGAMGSNWTTWGSLPPHIASNEVKGGGNASPDAGGAYWSANTFGNDQYSEVQVLGAIISGNWQGPVVRADATGQNDYTVIYYNGSTYVLALYKKISNAYTQIGSNYNLPGALNSGDVVRIEASGTTLTVKLNGTAVITQTDSAIAGGSPGLVFYGNDLMDNWDAGELTASPLFAVSMADLPIIGPHLVPLAATVTATVTMVRTMIAPRAFAVTSTLTPVMTRLAKFFRSFPLTITLTPTIARVVKFFRAMALTVTDTVTMANAKSKGVALPLTITFTAAMAPLKQQARQFAATVTLAPAWVRRVVLTRALSVTLTPNMIRKINMTLPLGATLVPTFSRLANRVRVFAVTSVLTPSMTAAKQARGFLLAVNMTIIVDWFKETSHKTKMVPILTGRIARSYAKLRGGQSGDLARGSRGGIEE